MLILGCDNHKRREGEAADPVDREVETGNLKGISADDFTKLL